MSDFASAVTPELRAEVERARRQGERAEALRPWARTRGTTNRYHWRQRYEEVDGVLHVIHADGSSGPAREGAVALLNQHAASLEFLSFRDGVLHNAIGAMSNIQSCVRLIRMYGIDWRGPKDDVSRETLLERVEKNTHSIMERLDSEHKALRKQRLDPLLDPE